MRVAALDADDKVVLKPVTLGRNLGNRVEIDSGLSLSDRLVDSPLESTQTGDVVNVGAADATPPAPEIDGKRQSRAEQAAGPVSSHPLAALVERPASAASQTPA